MTKKKNIAINFGSKTFRWLTIAGLSLILSILIILSFFLLNKNKNETIQNTQESLEISLDNAEVKLNLWIKQKSMYTKQIGRDPELVNLVKNLLEVPADRELLLEASALSETRAYFKDINDLFPNIGFFIINPDNISIGSSRDSNTGTKNLIAKKYPDLLKRTFNGEIFFVPPMKSDVSLSEVTGANTKKNPATMFFLGPVRNSDGQIIAAMTLRIDPSAEFTNILQESNLTLSSETYAICKDGIMLSESRFLDDLRNFSLLDEKQQSAMNLRVTDPGVNLYKSDLNDPIPENLPLTLMVENILKFEKQNTKQSGFTDMDGYSDYRGVSVYGTGIWLTDHHMGIISEVDINDVFATYSSFRFTVLLILGITIFLTTGSILLVLILGEKSNRELVKARDELEEMVIERTSELKTEEERSRLLLESIGEGIFGVDLDGRLSFVNKAAISILGFSKNELVGEKIHDLIHHSHIDGSHYDVKECPMRAAYKDGNSHYVTDEVLWRKDGSNFFVNYRSTPIRKGNELVGSVVTFVNVTEQKIRENEIKRLSTTVEQSPISIVITDPNGIIEYVNPKFENVTGYTSEEAIGNSPAILNSRILPKDFYNDMWDTISSGNDWHGEFSNLKKDGSVFWESASISPLTNAKGDITSYVALKEDITAKKQIEKEIIEAKTEAEAATKAKSDFLANMSHEIRTPMNAIIGLSHLIQKTDMSRKQADYIQKISGSAHNLLGIINDILDFSKIEAGKLSIESISFNLHEVFDNLGSMISEKAHDKGLELVFRIGTDVPSQIIGDPLRLGQILLNLANNAIKFTEKGEIAVFAELQNLDNGSTDIKFMVHDTGIGLTKEQQGKLFKAFSQADTSTTRKYGGTGLGLTISKKLTELMGGQIGVESTHGEGSTFFFNCVFKVQSVKKKDIIPVELKGLRVLIVDDNATSRAVLTEYTKDFSFLPIAVDNGVEAVQLIQDKRNQNEDGFELVLMDYSMPGLNGFQTAEKINELLGVDEQPKYILVTGYGRDEILSGLSKNGFEGFILKPVNQSLLFNTILQAFGKEENLTTHKRTEQFPEGFESIRGAKILLTEDNIINQQVAGELLQNEGFLVDIANDGSEALKMVQEKEYDIVLMDLQMPIMDGYAATKKIRSLKEFESLSIVAMTADAMTGVREEVISIGMNDYITKPIEPKELWKALVSWIIPAVRDLPEGYIPEAVADYSEPELIIANIDVESGLKRVGKNMKLYKNLLERFTEDFKNFAEELTALTDSGKNEEAIRLAHTLKGVSANLGVEAIRSEVAEIEKLLKDGSNADSQTLTIRQTVSETIKAIMQSGVIGTKEKQKGKSGNITDDQLMSKLSAAAESLKKRKPKPALKILDELEQYSLDEEIIKKLDEVINLLGKYKMKDAAGILEKMIEKTS